MTSATSNGEYERLWQAVLPFLKQLSDYVPLEAPGVTAQIERSRTRDFPLTATLSFIAGSSDEDVVIEIAAHHGARGDVLTTEILREGGEVLTPAIVRQLPSVAPPDVGTRAAALDQFASETRRFLREHLPTVLAALGAELTASLGRAARDRPITGQPMRDEFYEDAIVFLSTLTGKTLEPGKAPLAEGGAAQFDAVSSDGTVVAQVKWARTARLPDAQITDAVWRLQHVATAERRILLVGPSSAAASRWIRKFGARALKPIELWNLHDDALDRVA